MRSSSVFENVSNAPSLPRPAPRNPRITSALNRRRRPSPPVPITEKTALRDRHPTVRSHVTKIGQPLGAGRLRELGEFLRRRPENLPVETREAHHSGIFRERAHVIPVHRGSGLNAVHRPASLTTRPRNVLTQSLPVASRCRLTIPSLGKPGVLD